MSGFQWNVNQTPVAAPGTPLTGAAAIGQGLNFPLRMDPTTGDFMRSDGDTLIQQSMEQIIGTLPGERWDGLFGTEVQTLVWESSQLAADIAEPSIQDALTKYEPRIVLRSVTSQIVDTTNDSTALINSITYRLRVNNKPNNFVVPFQFKGPGT